jgi:hypothetical protein
VKNLDATPYVLEREADRWMFFPSPALARVSFFAFAGGSAFMVYLSAIFLSRTANYRLAAIFLLAAMFAAALAVRARRTRAIGLSVEFSGRVSHGDQELCPAGGVRAVRIADSPGGEVGDCEVVLALAGGKVAAIPSPYFAGFKTREQARPFAAKLAEVLRVEVEETH